MKNVEKIDIDGLIFGNIEESVYCDGCDYCKRGGKDKLVQVGTCINDRWTRRDGTADSIRIIAEKLNEIIDVINKIITLSYPKKPREKRLGG